MAFVYFVHISGALLRLTEDIEEPLDDDDIEVDVEECSDSESNNRPGKHGNTAHNNQKLLRQSPAISDCGSEPADLDRDGGASSPDCIADNKQNVKPKITCNCEELLTVDCHLETKDLWDKFHDLGTEMIITKTGR